MSSIYRVKYAWTCQKELLSSLKELERELKQTSSFGCLLKIFKAFRIDFLPCDYSPDEFASYDFSNEKQTSNQRSNQSNFWTI